MALETVEFIQGEKKNLDIEVHSIYNESFTITSGIFTLTDAVDDVIINATATRYVETINDAEVCKEIYYLLDTSSLDVGKYTGQFTYIVNTETLKYRFVVSIIE